MQSTLSVISTRLRLMSSRETANRSQITGKRRQGRTAALQNPWSMISQTGKETYERLWAPEIIQLDRSTSHKSIFPQGLSVVEPLIKEMIKSQVVYLFLIYFIYIIYTMYIWYMYIYIYIVCIYIYTYIYIYIIQRFLCQILVTENKKDSDMANNFNKIRII